MKQPSVAVGNRSAESARLAELLLAGIDSRPNGLRETALLLTAWTQLGVGYGMDRVWSPGQIRAAFRRLEKQGLATPVDEPDGRRWTPTSRALEAVDARPPRDDAPPVVVRYPPVGERSRDRVVDAIHRAGRPLTAFEVAEACGMTRNQVDAGLRKAREARLVVREGPRNGGRWRLRVGVAA